MATLRKGVFLVRKRAAGDLSAAFELEIKTTLCSLSNKALSFGVTEKNKSGRIIKKLNETQPTVNR